MNRLVEIIGPAPSEQREEEFLEALRRERKRVSDALTIMKNTVYKTGRKTSSKRKSKGSNGANKVLAKLKEQGLTVEDLEKFLGGKEN